MTVTLPPGWRPGCCRTAPRPGSCCGSAGSKAHAVRSSVGGNGPGRDFPTSLSPCLQTNPAGWVCSTVAPHHQTPLAPPLWVHPKAFRHTGPSHLCPGHPSDGSEQQWRIAPPWGLLPVACTLVCHPPAPLPTEPWAAGNKLLLSASFCPISSGMSQLCLTEGDRYSNLASGSSSASETRWFNLLFVSWSQKDYKEQEKNRAMQLLNLQLLWNQRIHGVKDHLGPIPLP